MAYTINKYNGSELITLLDGTLDRSTSLGLVGRNYAGYGEIQNENFVYLLENFANTSQPENPVKGQTWYNSDDKQILFNNGTRFKPLGTIDVSDTKPGDLQAGEFWWDTTLSQLHAFNGSEIELIGPQKAGNGPTRNTSTEVEDSTANTYGIIKTQAENTLVAVTAGEDFSLASGEITGFSELKKGINLASDAVVNGTATNAELLDNLNSTQFLRSDQNSELAGNLQFPQDDTGVEFTTSHIKQTSSTMQFGVSQDKFDFIDTGSSKTALRIETTDEDQGLKFFNNTVWHAGYQGTGSGLDADLLDGLHAGDFLRSNAIAVNSDKLDGLHAADFLRVDGKAVDSDKLDGESSAAFVKTAGDQVSGNLIFTSNTAGITWNGTGGSVNFTAGRLTFNADSDFIWRAGNTSLMTLTDSDAKSGLKFRGNTVWHSGNQGSGSGLDSDTLDGNQASDFLAVNGKAVDSQRADTANIASNSNALGGYSSSEFVKRSGDSLTGYLTLHSDPSQDNHAATKRYVDDLTENIDPIWAGNNTVGGVKSTYGSYPVGTKVSFWDERTYRRSANSNGGRVTISDRFRRTLKKVGSNSWTDIGG